MLLGELVDVLGHVTEAPKRADKVNRLVALLRRTPVEDVERVVGLLTGVLRVGHDSAGWSAVLADDVTAAGSTSLMVADVVDVAELVAGATGAHAVEQASWSLANLMERASVAEQAAIRSMLDPESDPPVSDSVMSSAIARAAGVRVGDVRHAASLNGSLPLTATLALLQGETALASVDVRAGHPLQPMGAVPTEETDDVLFATSCIEWAASGLRLQAHRAGRSVSLFVHDGVTHIDVTDELDAIADLVRGLPGEDLVLDGELAGTEIPSASLDESGRRARFFDVLFNGETLLDLPLSRRRQTLATLVPAEHLVPSVESSDPDDLARMLHEARSSGRPGVVVKDLAAPYEPGRRARSWRLVAPVRTLDLVIVAAEWGSGRRSDKLSRLHLAARKVDGEFEVVGRTALGMTDDMLARQTEQLLALAEGDVGRSSVVTVRPEQVVEVAFDSVRRPRSGGLSLRSARVRRYRDDLGPADADTVGTVESLLPSEQEVLDERRSRPTGDSPAHRGRRADDQAARDGTRAAPRLPPAPPPGLDAAQAEAAKRIREVLAVNQPVAPDALDVPPEAVDPSAPASASSTIVRPSGLPTSGYFRGHVATADLDFAPYEEPELETGRATHVLVMLVRFISLGWAVAITTAALITRSEPGAVDRSLVRTIGLIGIPIAAALAVTGWAWCDRLTRNLRRLDGRLPSRLRCVTGWLVPVATILFLALTVVRLEPTEVVDIRPAIVVTIFATVMWRPYSLIRRILATLIRVRSDPLLAAGYVLDLVAFGLLWWRLTVWSGDDLTTRGDVDIVVGIGAAVSIALAVNVLVWRAIVRAGDRAESHRASSQRTRYEHRMLRLRGVDPTDPEVWWALVQRRADEQRAEELRLAAELEAEARGGDADPDEVDDDTQVPTVVPTVDELVDSVKQRHSVAFRRLGDDQSVELEERLRAQFSTVVGDLGGLPLSEPAETTETAEPTGRAERTAVAEPTENAEPTTDSAPTIEDAPDVDEPTAPEPTAPEPTVDEPTVDESAVEPAEAPADRPFSILKALTERDAVVVAESEATDETDDDRVGDELDADAPAESEPDLSDDEPDDEPDDAPGEPESDDTREEHASDDATEGLGPLERLAARTAQEGERAAPRPDALRDRLEAVAGTSEETDPVSALKRRLGLDETVEDVKSPLEQLLSQAGTVQVEAALAERRQQEIDERPTERMVPPRLYALEWARLLLVVAFAAVTAAGGWTVSEVLGSSGTSIDGDLGLGALDVDLARRSFVGAYSVAIALIPLWTFMLLTYARRCGMEHARPRVHLALFALSAALCTAAFVIDGGTRGGTSALLLLPGALIAGAAGYMVEPARFWFDLPSVTLTVWTIAVPVMLGITWMGGMLSPLDESSSLQVLAFFTVTVSLVGALITVLIALSAADIEDEIRLSPELAVPLDRSRGRRS